jgi:hypothetical protein
MPPERRLSADWAAKRDLVDAAGGEPVLVAEGTRSNVAYRINTGYYAAFRPAGRYQAYTRQTSQPGLVDVWARLVL